MPDLVPFSRPLTPALKNLEEKPSLSIIKGIVEAEFESPSDRLSKKMSLYISRQKGGFSLREIGAFYGMKEAAVSQAFGRFRQEILERPSLKKILQRVLKKLEMSKVET